MPQERHHDYPFPTAADVEAATGGREIKAARNIMVRNIPGLIRRPYLMGDSDHAPILRGVADLTTACYALLDDLELSANGGALTEGSPAAKLKAMLEDHGCPAEAPSATAEAGDA